MAAVLTQSGSALVLVSLTSLGVVFAVCVCCRKKSNIIRSQAEVYDPQLFQSQSERFRVVRPHRELSRAVRVLPPFSGDTPVTQNAVELATEDEEVYQNVGSISTDEPTYVDPIPECTYQNLPLINPDPAKDAEAYVYVNMLSTEENHTKDSDSSDYENTEFLETHTGTHL